MAEQSIPNLTPVVVLAPDAQVWIVQDGVDYRASAAEIAQLPSTGVVFPSYATAPMNPVSGQAYLDTTLGYPRIYIGGTWYGLMLSV